MTWDELSLLFQMHAAQTLLLADGELIPWMQSEAVLPDADEERAASRWIEAYLICGIPSAVSPRLAAIVFARLKAAFALASRATLEASHLESAALNISGEQEALRTFLILMWPEPLLKLLKAPHQQPGG